MFTVSDFEVGNRPIPIAVKIGQICSILNFGVMLSFFEPYLLVSYISMIPAIASYSSEITVFLSVDDDSGDKMS